jgi:hypothetical protein
MVTLQVREKQLSDTVKVYVPAGSPVRDAVLPIKILLLFLQA